MPCGVTFVPSFPRFLRLAACLGAAVGLGLSLWAEAPFAFDTGDGHLPKTVVPSHYTVRLEPDLRARTFAGEVRIDITVREPVDAIVMNANALTIDSAWLVSGSERQSLASIWDPVTQQLRLPLTVTLAPGDYAVELTYRGTISSNPQGFFYDRYDTSEGPREMFGTQMEVADARRVLPCWDEPAFKATFDSTLVVPASFVGASNMPAVRETPLPDGRKAVTFDRTPRMSTYLLAYFGGEFEILATDHQGVRLRILTTAGKRELGRYALEASTRILDYYTAYFGVAYPLPQLDQIAVPQAFSNFGAMENWGCISYLEDYLLCDPATSAQGTKEEVFKTVAHEIAHQWFGNLVTMGWWDNLWLNEGFASWMETKCSAELNPDWQLWLRSNADKERALDLDARSSTHAIQLPGVTDQTVDDAFDVISYEKGRALIRMLEDYVGAEPFRAGLRLYMARHPYGNTTTADLWNAIADASGQPVAPVANSWTEQPGFPIITATLANNTLHLDQQRFILDAPEPDASQWNVPLTIAPLSQLEASTVHLLEADTPLELPWPAARGTPKLNVGDTGLYRVLYDETSLAAITAALPDLPETEQLNLLGDARALVTAGQLSSPDYLAIALALRDSPSQPVWTSLLTTLRSIDLWLRDEPLREDFHRWCVALLRPQLDRLGWAPASGESPLVDVLRTNLIYQLGWYGDPAVIAECQRRFATDSATLTGNLRATVLKIVGRYADRATYDALFDRYRTADDTEEKRACFEAIQHALDPDLARNTLQLTLGEQLGVAERNWNIMTVAARGEHLDLAWRFALEHADELLTPLASYGRNSYLGYIVRDAHDPAYAAELEAATRQHLGEEALPEARKTSSLIRLRAAVRARELPALRTWLARTEPARG